MDTELPYSPTHTEAWLNKYFSKNFYKKPYDRFMWWRSYVTKTKPLTSRHPFRDRIINGDFDITSYLFEAQIVEHKINKIWSDWGYKDLGRFTEECSLDRARRKRLNEDHEKEEARRLEEVKRGFIQEFRMTKEQYDKEVVKTRAKDLISFYYKMQDKYGARITVLKNVSKPLRLML